MAARGVVTNRGLTPRTRFAPSPTGDLHAGGAWTALAAWVVARRGAGKFVLRIEDLDLARNVLGAEARIEADLRWLGLDWDEGPLRQSERIGQYENVLSRLAARGLVYPCDCSRAEIARVASAPHPGEEVVYPGSCRDLDPRRPMRRPPALRVRVPDAVITHDDPIAGRVEQNLARDVGDFVVRRGDGVFAYQLAVVSDDLAMKISDVIRAADLLGSTPRQVWLARELGTEPPRYMHVPLVVTKEGARVEKRTPANTIAGLRAAGVDASRIVGALAWGLGLKGDPSPATAPEVARASAKRPISWRGEPWPAPDRF